MLARCVTVVEIMTNQVLIILILIVLCISVFSCFLMIAVALMIRMVLQHMYTMFSTHQSACLSPSQLCLAQRRPYFTPPNRLTDKRLNPRRRLSLLHRSVNSAHWIGSFSHPPPPPCWEYCTHAEQREFVLQGHRVNDQSLCCVRKRKKNP